MTRAQFDAFVRDTGYRTEAENDGGWGTKTPPIRLRVAMLLPVAPEEIGKPVRLPPKRNGSTRPGTQTCPNVWPALPQAGILTWGFA